jgi:hypothetical protein
MGKVERQPDFNKYRPSDYMRARHPEQFSDSLATEEYDLRRDVFEYYLDTLTSRKQEYEFEDLCRRIAEKEICPNLRPQTGPTGGGDSKVDSETYPVAEAISLRWYEGVGREAANQRWAFAFSTKKQWKPKVQQDVENISTTKRNYEHIYFISNQFIRDKDRAATEDELTNKYLIPVHIMDRNWIIKCVFEHGRQQLAIETLGLTQYEKKRCSTLGPKDTQKQSELQEIDRNIQDINRYKDVEYQLAEDCMRSAILARNLERTRNEVEGRFDRAEQIADKVNYRQQKMRIAYIRTWTAYFWYNDYNELNKRYDQVEHYIIGSEQSEDIEKLANLWLLLDTSVKTKHLDINQAKLWERKNTLRNELDRLAADTSRPNNAIRAQIRRSTLDIYESIDHPSDADRHIVQLIEIIETNHHLIDFPFDFISEVIPVLEQLFPNSKKFDQLFETIVNLTAIRQSKGATGDLLLQRGLHKLRSGKNYEAIKLFGLAQNNLTAEEYRDSFVDSLVGCAHAYESGGLLWAARRNILVAASINLGEFYKQGIVVPGTLYCLQ